MLNGNRIRNGFFAFIPILLAGSIAQAATLYKWVDEDGNVTYQDEPPPSNVSYEEQQITEVVGDVSDDVDAAIEEAARENPVSLYSIPICDVCDLVRLYLEKHSIPFAEKNVQASPVMQEELQRLSGGLSVPTLIVGQEVIDGYSKAGIRRALVDRGFPMEQIEEAIASAEALADSGEEQQGDTSATEQPAEQ